VCLPLPASYAVLHTYQGLYGITSLHSSALMGTTFLNDAADMGMSSSYRKQLPIKRKVM